MMGKMTAITDFSAPELDVYARLTENQLLCREAPENGMFIAESLLVIERALAAGYEPVSFLAETGLAHGAAAELLAGCGDVPVYTAELEVLQQLTGYALTRGLLCAMRRKPLPTVEAVCRSARQEENRRSRVPSGVEIRKRFIALPLLYRFIMMKSYHSSLYTVKTLFRERSLHIGQPFPLRTPVFE